MGAEESEQAMSREKLRAGDVIVAKVHDHGDYVYALSVDRSLDDDLLSIGEAKNRAAQLNAALAVVERVEKMLAHVTAARDLVAAEVWRGATMRECHAGYADAVRALEACLCPDDKKRKTLPGALWLGKGGGK